MSTTKSRERDPYIGCRVSEELKRKVEMRASELGLNVSEYLTMLVDDDLEGVDYLEDVDFE
jgi:predicted DNA binding CopG/RHH family protein